MWKGYLIIVLLVHVVSTQNVTENTENKSIQNSNSTTKINENNKAEIVIKQQEISKVPQNNTIVERKGSDEISNKPEPQKHATLQQKAIDSADEFDFKYYWILLVGSSLSILGLIIFKSFRMRRSRAEVRYGKPTESDEIEPLGSNTKWDDDSSENEDEIFDINFLKNTRLQKHGDNN